MALHHTQIKKLAAAALVAAIADGVLTISMEDVVIVSGPEANSKALIAEAINKTEDEDFDLDALREEQAEEGGEDEQDEQDEQEEAGSVVAPKYRAKYKEIGANDSNGDALALALRAHLTVAGEKAKDTHIDETAARALADANGVSYPDHGRNPGHRRMILGNILRGRWNRGHAVVVGSTTIQPTEEGKARMAAAMARDEAKNNRQAAPKQSDEERKAKAKARRQAKAAARKAAVEPAEEEQASA